jgi:hypothetical protein
VSVFHRMQKIQEEEEQEGSSTQLSKSQTLVLADKPTVARLRAVLAELSGFVGTKGTAKQKRMMLVVRRMANDICEELQDADQKTLSQYFSQMGQVIAWIGTGSYDGMNDLMREWIKPRAEAIAEAYPTGEADDPLSEIPMDSIDEPDPEFGDFVEEELVATHSGVDNGLSSAHTRSG